MGAFKDLSLKLQEMQDRIDQKDKEIKQLQRIIRKLEQKKSGSRITYFTEPDIDVQALEAELHALDDIEMLKY